MTDNHADLIARLRADADRLDRGRPRNSKIEGAWGEEHRFRWSAADLYRLSADALASCEAAMEDLKRRLHVQVDYVEELLARAEDAPRPDSALAPSTSTASGPGSIATCEDCPPVGYPTDKTRCAVCPYRAPPYGEWCRNPKACAGKGYCPLDPTCGD